jgi:succinate dehydrogenase flavin-adding protein (antitoxin of CptAB toxin-antitoxin module)
MSGAERSALERLLGLPDPELAAYLLGHEAPGDPALARLVRQIVGGRCAGNERR